MKGKKKKLPKELLRNNKFTETSTFKFEWKKQKTFLDFSSSQKNRMARLVKEIGNHKCSQHQHVRYSLINRHSCQPKHPQTHRKKI